MTSSVAATESYGINETTKAERPTKRALAALAGGGIREVVSIQFLEEIEKQTELATCKIFDLMGGTSAGAWTCAALNTERFDDPGGGEPQWSARQVSQMYTNTDLPEVIFPQKFMGASRHLYMRKYPVEGLYETIDLTCGDSLLKNSLTNTAFCLLDRETAAPCLYTSREAKILDVWSDLKVGDVVKAATAASTYFPPCYLPCHNGSQRDYMDDGLTENNPSMGIYIEGLKQFGKSADIMMVALGTGVVPTTGVPHEKMANAGILQLGQNLAHAAFKGSSDHADQNMRFFLGDDYHPLRVDIDHEHYPLDKTDSIPYLTEQVRIWLDDKKNDAALRELCMTLAKGK
jgi:patatin-like phospholipase/acyl hydrolase